MSLLLLPMAALYEHDYFPLAMIVLVLLSCVVLAVDSPGPTGTGPASRLRVIIRSCEAITIFIMAFEQVRSRLPPSHD